MKTFKASGLSLVELLVALLISSLLMLSFVEFFSVFRHETHNIHHNQDRFNESLLLIDFLQELFASAGFLGCSVWDEHQSELGGRLPIRLISKEDTHLPNNVLNRIKKGTIGLELHFQDSEAMDLRLPLTKGSTVIELNTTSPAKENQQLVISDCLHVETHRIKKLKNNKLNIILDTPLLYDFNKFTHVSKLRDLYLFVGHKDSKNYALYLSENNRSDELSSLVTNMEGCWLSENQSLMWIELNSSGGKQDLPLLLNLNK